MKKTGFIVILITCSSKEEANKIKDALLKKRQAACVNIIPAVQSFFWWQDKIDSAQEILLLVKTKSSMFKEIAALVKKIHKYEVPEIIALPITNGSKEYLEWIENEV